MARPKKNTDRNEGKKKVEALMEHARRAQEGDLGEDEARPHVSKQDVMEAMGKKRLGPPRAIQSKDGRTVVEKIAVTPPKLVTANLLLVGDSPLITNCWSWKVIQQMLRDHMQIKVETTKTAKKGQKKVRSAKDPYDIFLNSLYEHRDGGYGFPSNGVKKSLVLACSFVDDIRPKFVGGAVRVNHELSQVLGQPKARFDMVTVQTAMGKKSPDTRFRSMFEDWALKVQITFASSIISLEDITNLFMWAGSSVGIGEWRMEKDGNNGAFHVASEDEARSILKRLKPFDRKKMNEEVSGVPEILEKFRVFDFEEEAA